jgi:5-methylcytosine-specific restriction endonuclease McrA
MVMPLPMPAVDSVGLIAQVVAERQGGVNRNFFNEIQTEWTRRVQQYLDSRGSPHAVQQWAAVHAKSRTFLNLYLTPTEGSVQGNVLKTLRAHELTICPACGEPGSPNTLDHYLPKASYPHFCITPANLFPMCDACQKAKGEKTGDAHTPRFFIHPYFDVFVAQQVLRLQIIGPFDAPSFRLIVAADLNDGNAALVRTHVRELEIEKRYAKFFGDSYLRLLRLVHKMRTDGQDVLGSLTTFRFGVAHPTVNGWEHVFYDAVLSTPALLDYLTQANLPEYR